MSNLLRGFSTACLLVLAACAGPPANETPALPCPAAPVRSQPAPRPLAVVPPPEQPLPDPATQAGRDLVRWQDMLRQSAPDLLPAIAARVAAEPPTPANVVHLALVWLHTRAPGDAAKALTQLEAVQASTDPAARPWTEWVRLLAARAMEQKRLEEQVNRQTQLLRDNQRRIDQLTEQLEALKTIERSLAPRNNAGKTP